MARSPSEIAGREAVTISVRLARDPSRNNQMKLPMRACCLWILAGCLGSGSRELTPAYVENGRLAIELCAQEYTKLANRPFLSEVDRAYVYVVSDQLDVLFTRGEVGTFGKRSSTYSAILGCGVLFNQAKASEIYF